MDKDAIRERLDRMENDADQNIEEAELEGVGEPEPLMLAFRDVKYHIEEARSALGSYEPYTGEQTDASE